MRNLKLIMSLVFGLSLFAMPVKAMEGFSLGFTVGSHSLDQDANEDVDSNGSVDAKHSRSDSFVIPGIMASYTKDLAGMMSLTVGAEFIPVNASLATAVNVDTDTLAAAADIDQVVTNRVSADLANHMSVYIQPTINISDTTSVFGTLGYSEADVDVTASTQTSTSFTKGLTLEGIRYGIGIRHYASDSMFVQVEAYVAEYDTISATTSDSTKVSVDADDTVGQVTIGKTF
jgi:hypothetical protein